MHVYLHVPFCTRRCTYCDFAIAVRRDAPSDAYVEAVLLEWSRWQADPVWEQYPAAIETVYFGGGTPSKLEPGAIGRLLERIASDRQIVAGAEITLEANPEDVTFAAASAWRGAGVNRVSLGVQSFDPAVLAWMHRTHSADQVPRAVGALRSAGLDELSLDLIFALPAALGRDWSLDLNRALTLGPEHVSIYGLSVEPHTPLGRWTGRGEVSPLAEETYAAEFLMTHETLGARGYEHYEVSNAARPGHRARHNSAYWQRAPFIGLGPAAHSGFGSERRWNVRDWVAYQRLITSGRSPLEGREVLDPDAVDLEELYLGLRTTDGLAVTRLPPGDLHAWQAAGWASCDGGRVRLTPEGWLRLDALVGSVATREARFAAR